MPKPGPYYPCLLKMNEIQDFPFDHALYFSTDHHFGKGGIWLYLCNGVPSDEKNWISYNQAVSEGHFDYLKKKPKRNPIFVDRKQGLLHMETPYANIINNSVYMTYHKQKFSNLGKHQPTLLATSTDGIKFDRIRGKKDSVILRHKSKNSNTGYFRWAPNPFHRVDYKYIGYSLLNGGNDFQTAMWGSMDAINWKILQIFANLDGVGMEEQDKILNWHTIDPHSIRRIAEDEYVLISDASTRASGNQIRSTELYEVFVMGDGKTLTRKSRKILSCGPIDSLDSEEAATPTMVEIDNRLYLIYVGTTSSAKLNTLMVATGSFNPNAPLPEELTPEEQNRNFFQIDSGN